MSRTRARRPQAPVLPDENRFVCGYCARQAESPPAGTRHRNHCPYCLWSRHVDAASSGDRAALCKGLMEPVAVWVQARGEWSLVHRCQDCGFLRSNRIAGDDNPAALLSLAMRPIALPPFPLIGEDMP